MYIIYLLGHAGVPLFLFGQPHHFGDNLVSARNFSNNESRSLIDVPVSREDEDETHTVMITYIYIYVYVIV